MRGPGSFKTFWSDLARISNFLDGEVKAPRAPALAQGWEPAFKRPLPPCYFPLCLPCPLLLCLSSGFLELTCQYEHRWLVSILSKTAYGSPGSGVAGLESQHHGFGPEVGEI